MRLFAALSVALSLAGPAGASELVLALTAGGAPATDAVVMVRPDAAPRSAVRPSGSFVMSQRDMRFAPYVLVVPVGAEVAFPNLDPFHHHVYSFSKTKPFELKLYGKDETRRVRFDRAGVVAVGCNIHDDMSAFIRVVDTPFAAKSGPGGQVVIRDLPPGGATVTIWHPHLKGPEVVRRVALPADGALRLPLAVEIRSPRLKRGGY